MYKIIKFYFNGESDTIKSVATLEQAQAICQDPSTSSSTAKHPDIDERGAWFYGYQEVSA